MSEEIEVKNQKTLLASLRSDIIQAASALTKGYEDKKNLVREIKEAEAYLGDIKAECDAERTKIAQERREILQMKADANSAVSRSKAELEVVERQKRDAMNELKKLNEWVFTAESSNKTLESRNNELDGQITLKTSLILDIPKLEEKKAQVEEETKALILTAKLASDEAELKVAKADEHVREAEHEAANSKQLAQTSKELLEHFENERARKEQDLEIYIARIREKHEEMFPDRAFKI